MGFMDNVSTFTKGVGAKAKGNYDVANLNSQINNLQREIMGVKGKLGEKCYQYFKDNVDSAPEELKSELDLINSKLEKIESIKKQIEDTKEQVAAVPLKYVVNTDNGFCSNCGAPLSAGAAFCTKCGAKMVVNTVNEEPQAAENVQVETLVVEEAQMVEEPQVALEEEAPVVEVVEETVEAVVEEAPVDGKFCPNCGAQVPNDSMFCTNCGQKLD